MGKYFRTNEHACPRAVGTRVVGTIEARVVGTRVMGMREARVVGKKWCERERWAREWWAREWWAQEATVVGARVAHQNGFGEHGVAAILVHVRHGARNV